jgi:hypothetical protein
MDFNSFSLVIFSKNAPWNICFLVKVCGAEETGNREQGSGLRAQYSKLIANSW